MSRIGLPSSGFPPEASGKKLEPPAGIKVKGLSRKWAKVSTLDDEFDDSFMWGCMLTHLKCEMNRGKISKTEEQKEEKKEEKLDVEKIMCDKGGK